MTLWFKLINYFHSCFLSIYRTLWWILWRHVKSQWCHSIRNVKFAFWARWGQWPGLRGQCTAACRQNRANLNILSSWILHNGPPDTKENFQPKILTSDVMSSFFAGTELIQAQNFFFKHKHSFVCQSAKKPGNENSEQTFFGRDWKLSVPFPFLPFPALEL